MFSWFEKKEAYRAFTIQTLFLILFCTAGVNVATAGIVSYPKVSHTNDVEDVLESYQGYLNFVTTIGLAHNKKATRALEEKFEKLKKQDPKSAARFLKLLRYDLDNKLEFMGISRNRLHTRTSAGFRNWIIKRISVWEKEADEHLFRAVALSKSTNKK